jgi:hypothetical protein
MALNLITKQEYKTYSGIKSTNDDAAIDAIIPRVSQAVKNYCRRTFVDYMDVAKVETFSGGFKTLILAETPVFTISSVQRSENYGQTYTNLTQYTDWVLDDDKIVSLNSTGFDTLIKGYKVTYFAGYDDVPTDLALATMDIVNYYMKNDSAIHTHASASPNTMQVQYITDTQWPAHIKRILDLYVADYT